MTRLVTVCLLALTSLGADCEAARLAALDHGRLESPDGRPLAPAPGPWALVADPGGLEHPDVLQTEAGAYLDSVDVNAGLFTALDGTWPALTVLLHVGALPEPEWDEPGPGGVALLDWSCSGEGCFISSCVIVIDAEHAYHRQTFRDRFLHELGHCPFGLAHDGVSEDLNSCMSSPPAVDCEYTARDQRLMTEE